MRKKACLFAALWMFVLWLIPAAAAQSPDITFGQEKWDFGRIKEGEIVTHVFQFSNSGNALLKIQRVRTSCGCTAALISKKSLSPGEKGELKVTFNTRGYAGNVAKYIYVHSNDPRRPQVQLSLNASIDVPPRPQIALNKYTVDLGLVLQGEKLATETEIKNTGERELKVELSHRNAVFSQSGKEIEGILKIPAGESKKVRIELQPRNSSGLVREYVLVKSNDPRRSNLSVYMSGYVLTKKQLKELFDKYRNILEK